MRPDLCFDVSALGSKAQNLIKEDIAVAQKLMRRAKADADVGLHFHYLGHRWSQLILTAFSDAGWATRPSGHSQAG